MDISVVIPVSDDVRLEQCVASIHRDVEVIAALNRPTAAVMEIVERHQLKHTIIDERNLAKAYNAGIKVASRGYIFIMDSDCTFGEHTLDVLDARKEGQKLVKGKVAFRHTGGLSEIIARAREFHTSDFPNTYIPGLLIKQTVFDEVGYFNESLPWCADAEFGKRIKASGIDVMFEPTAVIYHAPLTVAEDLRSAFSYGRGKYRITRLHGKASTMLGNIRRFGLEGTLSKGPLTGTYLLIWYATRSIGLGYEAIRNGQ